MKNKITFVLAFTRASQKGEIKNLRPSLGTGSDALELGGGFTFYKTYGN